MADATKATKTDKIYIVPAGTDASAITKDVKFVLKPTATAYTTLSETITKADIATAAEYNKLTAELTAATKAAKELAGNASRGTSTTTDAFIMNKAKEILDGWKTQPDYAYNPENWPLKQVELGYAKRLPRNAPSIDGLQYAVHFEWAVDSSAPVTLNQQSDGSDYYVMVKDNVTEPTTVTFTVDVYYDNRKVDTLGKNGEYTALIGAPISVSANQPIDAPQFTVISDGTSSSTGATKFTGVVPITLNGADAIASVPAGCVKMGTSSSGSVAFNSISVDKVEKSVTEPDKRLNVTVSVTTGAIGGVWSENASVPASSTGELPNISIDTSGFVLKTKEEGNSGWYLPTDNTLNLGNMTVDVLTPAFTKVERTDDQATGDPTFTIHTQNMPENAKVEVALAKKDVDASSFENDNATIKDTAKRGDNDKYSVTFDKSKFDSGAEYYLWLRYGAPGSDWAYPKNDRPTYTPNPTTTSGGGESGGSGSNPGGSEGGSTGSEGGNPGGSEGGGGGSTDSNPGGSSGSTGGSDSGNTTEGNQTGA